MSSPIHSRTPTEREQLYRRIRKAQADNPELEDVLLAERFGVSVAVVQFALGKRKQFGGKSPRVSP